MKILKADLPCKDKFQTLISDDDVGLDSCFLNIRKFEMNDLISVQDPLIKDKILSLKRIICYWHKKCKLEDILKRSSYDQTTKQTILELFKML